ncbi:MULTISPECIES: murein L,D-transpeptidase catalytic domain family protein [Dyella]|uniref:Murein L,D-transpeptidase catalytic domain family protein n=2 Tax=Dyella TaxID=231454 RepID=A0A4R0YY24_9GAMM|nr:MULTISPECIES: murein L,D-transpeptidase catalytic domain family protein [Dyella]TBR40511.1 murein L,D-transpeptidase catalytic domain family protein [Dyella terrae]TCI11908.1 murein L,D-transpeptidase catalytic domain family protein [Dyella soli]
MMQVLRYAALAAAPILAVCLAPAAHATETSLAAALQKLAPNANPQVIDLALKATDCAAANGMPPSERLAVIDYSRPSTEPRLWVFDLTQRKLLFQELVAHGKNSGDNLATRFSNKPESLESSLGLFRTMQSYDGHNGYSLRMNGLEPGTNDKALERAIVIHGASYVDSGTAGKLGRIGRSWGCPAVRKAIAKQLIDTMKNGQYVFSYYPDQQWLASSPYLKCSNARMASAARAAP